MSSVAIAVLSGVLAIWAFWFSKRNKKPLPPGPPRRPFIGNALQFEPSHAWLYYADHAKQYGDVVSYNIFGRPLITLNSFEAIDDLLIKKSGLFCDRPNVIMCRELASWEQNAAILPANPRWQVSRKLAQQFVGPRQVPPRHTFLERQARDFAHSLSDNPDRFRENFKATMARIVLELTYGITVKSNDDEYVRMAENAAIIFGLATQPGKFLVDSFPILKYVPAWMPGAGFKRLAAEWHPQVTATVNEPFAKVKKDMASGVHKHSFVADNLENPIAGSSEDIVKWMAAVLYGASTDTTTGTLMTFFLNMVLHPDVQAKAQAEIDQITGGSRLPSLSDRDHLPYLNAVLKETMRFYPILPNILPYVATEDYPYRDWIIPKGSIVIANAWAVQRSSVHYEHPDQFKPERFINNPNILDPYRTFFGFGRRACPGQHIADAMLWITMATVLATCTVSKAVNELGEQITPTPEYTGGTVCEPVEFPYALRARSAAVNTLLQTAIDAAAV